MATSVVMAARISIHAPREGSDWSTAYHPTENGRISIHAPREGSDLIRLIGRWQNPQDFNPRSP